MMSCASAGVTFAHKTGYFLGWCARCKPWYAGADVGHRRNHTPDRPRCPTLLLLVVGELVQEVPPIEA